MKEFIKDYLRFSRKERNAAIVLLLLIGFTFSVPYWYKPGTVTISEEMKAWLLKTEQQLAVRSDSGNSNLTLSSAKTAQTERFTFNPNTLDANGFARLGINPKTINTIFNYRNKGGKFYKPDDFRKIYGLSKQKADELIPFIQLDNTSLHNFPKNNSPASAKNKKIDINLANEKDWETLPGIGQVFSKRIVSFREKLGGFYSTAQLKEVYGLKEETFTAIESYLNINPNTIRTININTATEEELAAHPYINTDLAKNIISYRNKNKAIIQLKELLVMNVVKEELFVKLSPYLTTK